MAGKRRGGKKIAKFSKKMQKKLVVLFVIIALLLLGLIVRLMYIEHTSGKKYEKKVLSQQKYDSTVIPYQRGNITDCKGTILATSVDVYNVILDCKVLNSDSADIDPTIDALITCFPQLNETDLRNLITDKPKSQYNVLAKKLSYEEIRAFEDMQAAEKEASDKKSGDAEKKGKINGVWFEKEYQREYPYGSLASAVVGFTTSGNLGMNGVENSYNSVLNGTNGREYGYLNSDSNFEKTVIDAQNGNDVTLTIDANIQKIVEDKIAAFEEEYRDAAREGAGSKHVGVIVMNPQNAEVLAKTLMERGLRIVSGGTQSHVMLVDLRPMNLTGKAAEALLGAAHITVNKNAIHNDPQTPFVTSGIRLGTPAMTTRGFKEEETRKVANLIADLLSAPEDAQVLERVRTEVDQLTAMFPVYRP